ncbi:hypothetical protein ACIGXA_20455 [Streptomyces fildesensis]|uniref:Bacterial toxin 27 domain-containing protein n=1 Tax=Streptomyces fildesensis TaxID=375757 RepID=A0ABW8C8X2_9ACTN
MLASTALVTVAAVTFTGSQVQPLTRTVPVGAAEDAPGFDLDAAAKTRAAQCLLNLMQRKGGQEMKSVARGGLNGTNAELLQAADPAYYADPRPPLDGAYNKDKASASAKMDELYDRHHEWEKSLNIEPPAGYTYTGFQWIEQKDNPFSTTGLSGWIADQYWQSEYDLFNEDQAPVANADSVAAVTKIATTRYSENRHEDYEDWTAWTTEMQFMHPMYADDARIFLQNGGFPTSAPDPASMEYRVDVEALKARFASCTTHNPPDPHHVLTAELITASTEWQQEIDGQRAQRDTILGEEAKASADLQIATQALGEALGQSTIASRLADWQAYWLKQTPAGAGLSYPAASEFTKVKADIVKAQAMALGRLFVASRAAQSAQLHANIAVTAQQAAYGIADAAGLPRGRGLLYGQQAVQVTRASAAAAAAVAKATETASNATRASAADSKTLNALAQTQAHASAAEFRRIAAQEAAAQAKAAADGAAVQATKAAENAVKAKAAQAKAEAAENTAKNAAADAKAKRATAETERDKAAAYRATADAERAKAATAEARAQEQRTAAATALSAAQTAGSTAETQRGAAVAAEIRAATARDQAVAAERNKNATASRARALEAAAAAAEGSSSAGAARQAATEARTAANQAATAATAAGTAAGQAGEAAVAARTAATQATGAAARSQAAAEAAAADVVITGAAVKKAHAAAAEAIAASEGAAQNVKNAEALAKEAAAQSIIARQNATAAQSEAVLAAGSAVRTAGFAYATAQAAVAARDSAAQVINPANDAIELGSPYKETDASAGLAVLSGQAAKTAAEQQAALATAKAAQAAKAATEAKALAAKAAGDAKAAATAAAEAADSASKAAASVAQARASAAEAAAAAAAATKAETNTVEYDRQAVADSLAAKVAAGVASGEATAARASATEAEQDAASARGAANAAQADATQAGTIATAAERDATSAETAASNAHESATEADQAATRAEEEQRKRIEANRADRVNGAPDTGPDLTADEEAILLQTCGQTCVDEWRAAKAVTAQDVIDWIKANGAGIILDLVGYTDAKACFSKGDIEACLWTLVNAGSYALLILKFEAVAAAMVKIGTGLSKFFEASAAGKRTLDRLRKLIEKVKKDPEHKPPCKTPLRAAAFMPSAGGFTRTGVVQASAHASAASDECDIEGHDGSTHDGDGELDLEILDDLDKRYGTDAADGVDYNYKKIHNGTPKEAADHTIPGIGLDTDKMAAYFAKWRGKATHKDPLTGNGTVWDPQHGGVVIIINSRFIHGYSMTEANFLRKYVPLP